DSTLGRHGGACGRVQKPRKGRAYSVMRYSLRKATTGSMRAAREEGIQAASAAVTSNTVAEARSETGSLGETSNRSPRMVLAKANEPAKPATTPIPVQIPAYF